MTMTMTMAMDVVK